MKLVMASIALPIAFFVTSPNLYSSCATIENLTVGGWEWVIFWRKFSMLRIINSKKPLKKTGLTRKVPHVAAKSLLQAGGKCDAGALRAANLDSEQVEYWILHTPSVKGYNNLRPKIPGIFWNVFRNDDVVNPSCSSHLIDSQSFSPNLSHKKQKNILIQVPSHPLHLVCV